MFPSGIRRFAATGWRYRWGRGAETGAVKMGVYWRNCRPAELTFCREYAMLLESTITTPCRRTVVVVCWMAVESLPRPVVSSAIAAIKNQIDRLFAENCRYPPACPRTAVGMPSDDDADEFRKSYNAISASQIYAQGAALVSNAIAIRRHL